MWSLQENEKELLPLKFSNGKTQEDIVREVVEAIKQGKKIVFIRGVCGTGKSVIALNIAKEMGKTSIVVPIKSLQKQYEQDYTEKKQIFKKNQEKLKISIIKGRQNFPCEFLKENSIINEKNSTLDIFNRGEKSGKKELSADCAYLPCKIEIKEKNEKKIREYLEMNKKVHKFMLLKHVRRMSIAPVCKYWSPIARKDINLGLEDAKLLTYRGLENKEYTIYRRKEGCKYYEQYLSYINSDVLIFNSLKYKLETLMDRKPATEIEIIDECDEFLDSFANSALINLNRFAFAMFNLYSDNEKIEKEIKEMWELLAELMNKNSTDLVKLKETKMAEILRKFSENAIMDFVECDEENYCYHVEEVAKEFFPLLEDSFISFEKEGKETTAKIVSINLKERFKEFLDKNKAFVLMSGTIHSEKILKEIFGLKDFQIIEAETEMPGKITKLRTGLEFNCSYETLKMKIMREKYLLALSKCIEQAIPPILVHVNAFYDLPTEEEAKKLRISVMTREKFKDEEHEENVRKFKRKEIKILYTTKCSRGIDFPGDVCNSIILTKYPYPNISDIFWKLLRKSRPEHYNDFYRDKAKRELMQKIYRGLRSKDDHIYLLSPDARVMDGI